MQGKWVSTEFSRHFPTKLIPAFQSAARPLVFFVNGIGDHILAIPSVRALAQLFDGNLTLVVARGPHGFLFERLKARRVAISIKPKNNHIEFDSSALREKVGKCDLFVSLTPWLSGSLRNLLQGFSPCSSIGFFPDFKTMVELNPNKHSALGMFEIVRCMAPRYNFHDFAGPLRFRKCHEAGARLLRAGLRPKTRILAVHADTSDEKMWDVKRLAKALNIFLDRHRDFSVVLVGWTPPPLKGIPFEKRIIPYFRHPFALQCCLVARADFFLGVDSCMLHVADLTRVPSVGLFGPTRAENYGFVVGPNITLQAKSGMDQINEGQVILALESLVSNPHQSAIWAL